MLAETLIAAGQAEAAGAVLDSAFAAAAAHDDRWWLPELYRLDARRHRGQARAELLCRAISLAGQQGSQALIRRAEGDLDEGQDFAGTDGERFTNGLPPTLAAVPSRTRGRRSPGGNHDHNSTAGPV